MCARSLMRKDHTEPVAKNIIYMVFTLIHTLTIF